jgi:ATP-dependent DNA ligase
MSVDPEITQYCVLKVFDIVQLGDHSLLDLPQIDRKELLSKLKLTGPLQEVEYYPATEHRKYYDHILSKNGEGIMLKNKFATYQPGRRTVKCWFKRKKRDLYDVVIMGFTKGEGKYSNVIGAIEVGMYVGGNLRKICNVSGMSDKERELMANHPENYIGRTCSVYAMEQDENSLALIEPSFSHLRIDKRPEECIYVSDLNIE